MLTVSISNSICAIRPAPTFSLFLEVERLFCKNYSFFVPFLAEICKSYKDLAKIRVKSCIFLQDLTKLFVRILQKCEFFKLGFTLYVGQVFDWTFFLKE